MKKTTRLSKLLILSLTAVLFLSLYGCGQTGKRKKALEALTDNLRASYNCRLTYSIGAGENAKEGEATLCRNADGTRLDILSPSPYSGLSVEYGTGGLPSSVAVHFSGIDTTLPTAALSRINILASLSADDFLSVLSSRSADKISEYDLPDEKTGYFANVPYGDAEITLCFAQDGSRPYSLSYSSGEISADIIFTEFEVQNTADASE